MSAGTWRDLLGTLKSSFQVALGGVRLKNSSGNLLIRNSADSADTEVTSLIVHSSAAKNVVGLELNSAAAGSGADWKMGFKLPNSGMTAAMIWTYPPTNGTSGQVLSNDGTGVLSWVTAGSTASSAKVDTTNLAFGTSSPAAMFSTGAADVINKVRVIIDTAFNGTPTLSIGISGTTSKYMGTGDVDLTAAAGTVFEVCPGLVAAGIEALIATYSAGGASAGAARIEVEFDTPQ